MSNKELPQFIESLQIISKFWEENAEAIIKTCETLNQIRNDTLILIQKGAETYNNWYTANEKLAAEQYVFTDYLSRSFAKQLVDTKCCREEIEHYYFDEGSKRFNALVNRLSTYPIIKDRPLFLDVLKAYSAKMYHIACLGLFSLLDGLLSEITQDTCTSCKKKAERILDDAKEDCLDLSMGERKIMNVYTALPIVVASLFGFSDFSQEEPEQLNRNWIVHGRSHRAFEKHDCLKLFMCLEGILMISDIHSKENVA